jgi:hypothetical protein
MRLRLLCALATTFLCGALAASDLTITFASKGKGPMGTGGNSTEVQYMTSGYQMIRNAEAQRDDLVDFKQGVSYNIDHKKKVISKISFDDAMSALEAVNNSQSQGLGKLMGGLFGDPNDVKVEQAGTEKVAGRDCQIWHIKVGKLLMDLSADPTLKPPMPEGEYARMMQVRAAQFAKAGPMGATYKRLYEEMAKIKGVPLKTHMSGFMGVDNTREATKVDTGAVPAATFALPEGYKVEDMGKQLKEQMAKAGN